MSDVPTEPDPVLELAEGVGSTVAEGPAASASRGGTPDRLGDYRVLRLIGSGGMGIVYEVERESLACRVALKVIHPRLRADPDFLRRFRNEARAAAGLHHTNIVPVFDFGDHEGIAYYAMQYIQGLGMDRILVEAQRQRRAQGSTAPATAPAGDPPVEGISRGLLTGRFETVAPSPATTKVGGPGPATADDFTLAPPAPAGPACEGVVAGPPPRLLSTEPGPKYYLEVARVGRQVAEALAYAHGRGVLHRDIKPSNLLLDAQGHVWITDFGLAKIEAGEGLTQSRDVAGTLGYMAPERFRGQSLRQSDVYALGATLYELLTFRPAFEAADQLALMGQICHRSPTPPKEIDRRIPRDLETIVLKAMAKEPTDRYPTAAALAEDLGLFGVDRSIKARRSSLLERSWRWSRRNPAMAALSTAVALILVAVAVGSTLAAVRFNRAAEANRRLLVQQYVGAGVRHLADRDPIGSLPWFAEALRRDHADPAREQAHRIRLAAVLRACPRLVQVWDHDGGVISANYDASGRRVLTASTDHTARVWDAVTGSPITQGLRHGHSVRHAAFSPDDGRRILTASLDGSARIWNASTGELLRTLEHGDGIRHGVRHASFSPDGSRIVTASQDQTACVWDAATGARLGVLKHGATVWHADFSPDGSRIATADEDGTARTWDAETFTHLRTLKHERQVRHLAFSPDGSRILTASRDHTAGVWNAATGERLWTLQHDGLVWHAAFDHDGSRVVTASHDGTARIWDALTGVHLTSPLRHGKIALHGAFSHDGSLVVTTSDDGTARVWDAANGTLRATLPHGGPVQRAAFSPDNRHVVTASDDGTARIWDVAVEVPRLTLPHGPAVCTSEFSPDGRLLVTAGEDGTARIWNSSTGACLLTLKHDPAAGHILNAAFSPDGLRVVTAGQDRTAQVWNAISGERLRTLKHGSVVWRATFNHDGSRIVTVGADARVGRYVSTIDRVAVTQSEHQAPIKGTVKVWDATTDATTDAPLVILEHGSIVTHAAFNRDGTRIVTASGDGTAQVWNAASGVSITGPLRHGDRVDHAVIYAEFSPDGTRIVTANYDGKARIWDVATGGDVLPPLEAHTRSLSSAAYSRDGTRIVTASDDGTARVWDAATGKSIAPPMVHNLGLWHAAFSRDGRHVVTASDDGTARIWEAATGAPLTPPFGHGRVVRHATFSPVGFRIATAGDDGTARIWDFRPDPRPLGDLVRMARMLAGHQLHEAGGLMPIGLDDLRRDWLWLRSRYPSQFTPAAGPTSAGTSPRP